MQRIPIKTSDDDKPDLWLTRVRADQFLRLAQLYGRRQAVIDMLLANGHRHMETKTED